MKIIYNPEISYFKEALLLGVRVFNQETNNFKFDDEKLSLSKEELSERFSDLVGFLDATRNKAILGIEKYEELENLFKSEEGNNRFIILMVYSALKYSISEYSLEDLREVIISKFLSQDKGKENDFDRIFEGDNLRISGNALVLELTTLSDVDEKLKLELIKLYTSDEYLTLFYYTILRFENIIKEELYRIKDIFELQFEKIKTGGIEQFENFHSIKNFEFASRLNLIEVNVIIQSSNLYAISISQSDTSPDVKGDVLIGLVAYVLEEYKLKLDRRKELIGYRLQTLSEPTKFEIIYLLSKERLYGKEISERLDISKGTISQHMVQLIDTELVDFTNQGKKIYYKLNKHGFRRIVEFLEDLLGESYE